MIGTKQRAYGIDLSRWELSFDSTKATPDLIDFCIIKAGEGLIWKDPLFEAHYAESLKVMVNGAFHYLRSGYSGTQQADFFLSLCQDKKLNILAIDFERIGNIMNDDFVKVLYDCLVKTTQLKPVGTKVILYTNPDIYNTIIYPATVRLWGRDVFQAWDLWIAQYPYTINVDGQPVLPKNRTDWKIWQFSDAGNPQEHGTDSEVDVNIFNGSITDFSDWLGIGITHQSPYLGVDHYTLKKNGVDVFVTTLDMRYATVRLAYYPYLETVAKSAKAYKAQIAVNGNAWDWRSIAPYIPKGLAANEGKVIANDKSGVPFINFSFSKTLSMPWNDYSGLFTAVSGFRYLVQNGIKSTKLDDQTNIDNIELHARSAKGITRDGKLILIITDGTPDMKTGTTLSMLGDIFMQFNTLVAMDNDSGGSSTEYIEKYGGVVNTPSDGHDRAVSTVLLFYLGENNSMAQYDVLSKTYNMTLRPDHNTGAVGVESVPMNTIMKADLIWTATEDLYKLINGVNVKINSVGDKWAHVINVNGIAKDLWVAIIHNGVTYCSYTDTTPTSSLPALHFTITAAGYPDTFIDINPL